MESDTQLNLRVAQEIMGWKQSPFGWNVGEQIMGHYVVRTEWNPSNNTGHAFEVVQKMHELGFSFSCGETHHFSSVMPSKGAAFTRSVYPPEHKEWECSEIFPRAICIAALKTISLDSLATFD